MHISPTHKEEMDIDQVKANILRVQERGWFVPGSLMIDKWPRGKSPKGYREAAVLFLINQDLKVLLTKRSMSVSNFKGHSCLPGGSLESNDRSLLETALREAQEEVNLDPKDVEVVCALPPIFTIHPSLTIVTPVVAITRMDTSQLKLCPNPAEVDALYWVPLQFFISSPPTRTMVTTSTTHAFDFLDPETEEVHVIYGLTAYVCIILSSIALQKHPANVPEHKAYLIKETAADDQGIKLLLGKLEDGYGYKHEHLTSKL